MIGFFRGAAPWALGLFLVLLPGHLPAQSPPSADQSFDQSLSSVCDHAAQSFIEDFRSRLKEAEARSPEAVLNFFAQGLTLLEQGYSNPRISLRLWGRVSTTVEADVFDLTAMSGFSRAGKQSAKALGFFITPEGEGRQFRFYREVRAGQACLACHGPKSEVEPGVGKLIESRFPGFDGFGYQAGQVLGAVGIRVRGLPAD